MNTLLVAVQIAGERVAFRAADIQSVVELDTITPVPSVPDFIAGLSALRSRPLTVIDSAVSLGLDATPGFGPIRKAVVVEQDNHLYAVLVDGIEDAISAESDPLPPPGKLDAGWQRCSLGLVETTAGVLLMIDPLAIIAGPVRAEAA